MRKSKVTTVVTLLTFFIVFGVTTFSRADDTKTAKEKKARKQAAQVAQEQAATESAREAELKASLEKQARTIQELTRAMDQMRAQMQQQMNDIQSLKSGLDQSRSTAEEADKKATELAGLPKEVQALTTSTDTLSKNVAEAKKSADDAKKLSENLDSIRFKGITLTPGGFMAAETVWRSKALSADINTPFNSIPLPGSPMNQVSEFNASGRQSRISMLAEGKLGVVKIGGYYEADFLSAGVTSNNNQSNSYTFRQRQFWGQAKFDSGWTLTGGQMWSLVTETKKGLDNRTEATPMTIDAQYTVGFSWARQYGFRVAKNFGDKVWLGFSVESPATTLTVHGNNNNFLLGAPGTSGGLLNPIANYAFSAAPDFIAKAAFEPGWGHFEVFGVLRTFRDRVYPNYALSTNPTAGAFNDSRMGGGVGVNARVPLANKKVDVGLHFLGGDGIGRYGNSGLADVTVRPDGTLAPIHNFQSLGTVELHPTPKLDIYMYVGGEYAARTAYTAAGKGVGYGSPLFNNFACYVEPLPGSSVSTPTSVGGSTGYIPGSLGSNCTGDTKSLTEASFGFWYRFYKGPKGTIQFGPQYSYVLRNTWSGIGNGTVNGVVVNSNGAPHGIENMVFTSFRYYIP
jgi:hypothetical protein